MGLREVVVGSLVAYAYLLLVLRLAGKRAITTATPLDFVMSLVVADCVDSAVFREVPLADFFVAVATLVLVRIAIGARATRIGPYASADADAEQVLSDDS